MINKICLPFNLNGNNIIFILLKVDAQGYLNIELIKVIPLDSTIDSVVDYAGTYSVSIVMN